MDCRRVARRLAEIVETDATAGLGPELEEHLRSCTSCSKMAHDLERTWNTLSHFPVIEPSPDLVARLRERRAGTRLESVLRVEYGWQWMTVAAVLLLGLLLGGSSWFGAENLVDSWFSARMLQAELNRADRLDDRFLRELEQSLDRWETDYLAVYDSGPSSIADPLIDDLPASPSMRLVP